MNVLVTGATGFIGRFLVRRLVKENYKVYSLIRNEERAKKILPEDTNIIKADITDFDSLKKLLNLKIDILFHCAAYVKNKNRRLLLKVNVEGTENIFKIATKLNPERIVYLSSVAVVSGNKNVPLEENLPYKASNIYGESKIEAEKIALKYRKKGLKTIILRPPMVYGEEEPHAFRLICFLLKHRLFPLIDEGRRKLHLVYVKNLIEACLFSLDKEEFLKDIYFVADNEVLSIKEVFTIIAEVLKAPPPFNIPNFLKPICIRLPFLGKKLRFFLKERVYKIDKIKSLGFKPPHSAYEALTTTAKYFKQKYGEK